MAILSQSITILTNILLYVFYSFAIPHHLRTFFSPFKRVTEKSNSPGLNLQEMAEVFSYNLVSICMGMILRTFVLFAGLLILFLVFCVLVLIFIPFTLILFAIESSTKPPKNLTTFQELTLKTSFGKFIKEKLNISDTELKSFVSESDLNNWLQKNLLDEKDISRLSIWHQNLLEKGLVNLLDRSTVTKISGFGSDWSYGYTNELNKYEIPQGSSPYPRVVGRDKEVEQLENILSKTSQNSAIIAGEPGVGRHTVIDELSRRLFAGTVPPSLVGFRTFYIDLKSVLSGFTEVASSRKMVLDLFQEARFAGNVIIVIDDIDKFFETTGEKIDLTDILNETLSDGKLRVVGLTTKGLADKFILQNTSLLKIFSLLNVEAPDIETVFLEMELSIVPVLQKEHKVRISYSAIKEAVTDADRFISTTPFPEKAIDILDETISYEKNKQSFSANKNPQILLGTDVQNYLSEKTKIPIGNMTGTQKDKLVNLETILHQRVFGQDEAITAVSKAMRRAVLSVSSHNKPVGTFLFLGPTGVGKTETAKALAQVYFGDENRMVRFDMSEYQGEAGLARILDELPKALVNNPFAVVLLDEIEKSPSIILNLFLTLLDEGYITDSANHKVSAKENIIIGTSNAGALYMKDHGAKGLIDYIQSEKIFSPEFLNRFDATVVFQSLDTAQVKAVTKKMLAAVAKRLTEKKITLEFTDALIEEILQKGYDPKFGARSIQRYIQDVVEDKVSQELLKGSYPPGSTLKI